MSLDVYLNAPGKTESGSGIYIREGGRTREITRAEWDEKFPGREPVVANVDCGGEVFWRNITSNLTEMAAHAGIYTWMWHPDQAGVKSAADLVGPLSDGLAALKADPSKFQRFNPENGWGRYEDLVEFVEAYLEACKKCFRHVW